MVLQGAQESLQGTGLEPGRDYQLLAVSIDPRETPDMAGPEGPDLRNILARMKEFLYRRPDSLSGGVVRPDVDDNTDLYGPKVTASDVVMGTTITAPPSTAAFMTALGRK